MLLNYRLRYIKISKILDLMSWRASLRLANDIHIWNEFAFVSFVSFVLSKSIDCTWQDSKVGSETGTDLRLFFFTRGRYNSKKKKKRQQHQQRQQLWRSFSRKLRLACARAAAASRSFTRLAARSILSFMQIKRQPGSRTAGQRAMGDGQHPSGF